MSAAPDDDDGAPHPRERLSLLGHDGAERAFLDAYRAGRLHHAWLIGGPEGIGKATLAYRIARFLFAYPDPGAPEVARAEDLYVAADDPAARLVAGRAHPDLVTLGRRVNPKTGRLTANIPIDDVRRVGSLFASTAGRGGYRICILDAADDLERAGANALLKSLEEPPSRGLFLIVSHAPQRLLPTIRSRCRRLALKPLDIDALRGVVTELAPGETGAPGFENALARAGGSVRRALTALDPDRLAFAGRVRALLDRLPGSDLTGTMGVAEAAGGRDGEALFDELLDVTRDWLSGEVAGRAGEGAGRLAPLAELWSRAEGAAREAQAYNLDRKPFVLGLFRDLATAVGRSRQGAPATRPR